MKLSLLTFLLLVFSFETFAQRRPGPRERDARADRQLRDNPYVRGDRYDDRRGDIYDRYDRGERYEYGGSVVYRPNPNVRIVIGPRYTPHRPHRRVIRDSRRSSYIRDWEYGYTCDFGRLSLNGRIIHDFYFSPDCYEALRDLRTYGDFCDGPDMFDSRGLLEAQFYTNYECKDALGYFY